MDRTLLSYLWTWRERVTFQNLVCPRRKILLLPRHRRHGTDPRRDVTMLHYIVEQGKGRRVYDHHQYDQRREKAAIVAGARVVALQSRQKSFGVQCVVVVGVGEVVFVVVIFDRRADG